MIKPLVCALSRNFALNLILKDHLTTAIYVYVTEKKNKTQRTKVESFI